MMSTSKSAAPFNRATRPILLVANSSWYLLHYRRLLLEVLLAKRRHVIALSPVDSTCPELSKLVVHIPWRIHRSTDSSPFSLCISFLRQLFLVRAIKPGLVHSHTLKANLLAVVVTSIFGIPCVLSFAGMGRLSKAKGPSRLAFLAVLRIIAFFAFRQRYSRWRWRSASSRTALIFQNPIDQKLFQASLPNVPASQIHLIPGSGVPSRYLQRINKNPLNHWWIPDAKPVVCDLIFCARLLRSKGIFTFLDLSRLLDRHRFSVFGAVDPSSKDSLLSSDLSVLHKQYPQINFFGSEPDPLMHINSNFPVLLVPSSYGEGLPRAVVEAFSLGIPVIISRAATCGIFSSSTVYVADGDSAIDYLKCFEQLLADHSAGHLQQRLQAGRALVIQQLSERVVVQKTMSIYESLQRAPGDSYLLDKDHDRLQYWLAQ